MPPTINFLKSLPYFAALRPATLDNIARTATELSFARGEVVILEGEPCRGLYIVRMGRVRIFKSSAEGREQVLYIAGPGDTFNDVPVFDDGANPASASALEPATIYLIPRQTMTYLATDSQTAQAIIKVFATRLRHLTTIAEDLSFRSVPSRLAKLLLKLAVVEGGEAPIPQLTQDEMAAMVGSVRDVVGRSLRTMTGMGVIEIKGKRITITDPDKLKDIS
ncbi:MAG: Crp/Fnr family transcriptional regulator [Chloroflexota bacterium]